MIVATCLTIMLATLIFQAWSTFAVPAMEVEARAQITLSANLAAEALARDLGGYQLRTETDPDRGQVYRFYKLSSPFPSKNQTPPLQLVFQREDQTINPDTITVTYDLDAGTNTLVRQEDKLRGGGDHDELLDRGHPRHRFRPG
jgi:hypothetical protein